MELLTGRSLNYNKHCKLPPGAYCFVHEENLPTNSMKERATGAIAIGPTAKLQGAYRCMSLKTGHIITRRKWTVMLVPPEAIEKVEKMAGDKDLEIVFTYDGTIYSKADEDETLTDDSEGNQPEQGQQQQSDELNPVEPEDNENAGVENEEDGALNQVEELNHGEEEASVEDDDTPDDELQVPDVQDEEEAPLLAEHVAEPGGPAARTRSTTAATGRRYFYRLEDGQRMRNEK